MSRLLRDTKHMFQQLIVLYIHPKLAIAKHKAQACHAFSFSSSEALADYRLGHGPGCVFDSNQAGSRPRLWVRQQPGCSGAEGSGSMQIAWPVYLKGAKPSSWILAESHENIHQVPKGLQRKHYTPGKTILSMVLCWWERFAFFSNYILAASYSHGSCARSL